MHCGQVTWQTLITFNYLKSLQALQASAFPDLHNVFDKLSKAFWSLPGLSSTLSSRPMVCRCLGVDTDSARTSPMASWNPGLAPSRNEIGWSLYWRKYCTWPISWCTVIKSSMFTTVHCLILGKPDQKSSRLSQCSSNMFSWFGSISSWTFLTFVPPRHTWSLCGCRSPRLRHDTPLHGLQAWSTLTCSRIQKA